LTALGQADRNVTGRAYREKARLSKQLRAHYSEEEAIMKQLATSALLAIALIVPLAAEQAGRPGSPAAAPRLDAWRIIGPGGGGAQFLPTVSPHDPKHVLVACDMTGAYISQDGGDSWRMFNLRGTVRFFEFDPVSPDTIYASGIGLWRSTDGGQSWGLVFPDPGSVTAIEMPDDHADARIATTSGTYPRMTALAIDPTDSKVLFAAIAEDKNVGLFVSRDRGKSWKKDSDLAGGAKKIYIDPRSPAQDRTLYVVGDDSVAVRAGGHWERGSVPSSAGPFRDISAGFPPEGGAPVIYVLSSFGSGGVDLLYISHDGGKTWRLTSLLQDVQAYPAPRLAAVAACADRPDVAYASYAQLRRNPSDKDAFFGVAKTTDGGRTWKLVWKESQERAGNLHDVWITERFGPGWGENPLALGVSPMDPNICFGTDYGRTMRTRDGGDSWQGVYSKKMTPAGYTTTGLDVTTNYGVHFDPFDPKHLFITYTDIGLFHSEDGGVSWSSATKGVPDNWVNTTYWIAFDPEIKGRVWGVMSGTHDLPRPKMWRRASPEKYLGGVCVSDDGGRTWRKAGEGLPQTAATHILIDPGSPTTARVLYVTGFGRGVFKSADGGKTWSLKNKGIEGKEPFAWRLARDRNGVLYLVVARRSEDGSYGNDRDGALYRSRDGAETWEKLKLPEGLNGPNGLTADPEDPNRLYLACWGRRTPKSAVQGGIFLSTDAGATWRNVLSKDQHIYDVTIDVRAPLTLYACGFESSAWRSTDRGITWIRIRGYNFKWGHRVVPDPYNPGMIYVATFGGSVWYGPAVGDPKALEDIVTPEVAYTR
jgi:photosystem II stability/assembly factor-like uncharacterized protein